MEKYTIYHNTRCSKSRKALDILESHHLKPTVIEYLKTPLQLAELKSLRNHFALSEFVRTDEALFKELKLSLDDEEAVLQAMAAHPILMQRPIVIDSKRKAVIARPPEKVLELIGKPLPEIF